MTMSTTIPAPSGEPNQRQSNSRNQTPVDTCKMQQGATVAVGATATSVGGVSNLQHVLKAAKVTSELSLCQGMNEVHLSLEEAELWRNFKKCENEMIVTKSGRRMFPVIKVRVSGLDASCMYSVVLDFIPADTKRWKYVNGRWEPCTEKQQSPTMPAAYLHPDSPNFGSHWMTEPISFSKVKLSNKDHTASQILLNSLHKYQPRIHIVKLSEPKTPPQMATFEFSDTQFIAVTAYQNEQVTSLKIKHNPFAKAFLETKEKQSSPVANTWPNINQSASQKHGKLFDHGAMHSHLTPYSTWPLCGSHYTSSYNSSNDSANGNGNRMTMTPQSYLQSNPAGHPAQNPFPHSLSGFNQLYELSLVDPQGRLRGSSAHPHPYSSSNQRFSPYHLPSGHASSKPKHLFNSNSSTAAAARHMTSPPDVKTPTWNLNPSAPTRPTSNAVSSPSHLNPISSSQSYLSQTQTASLASSASAVAGSIPFGGSESLLHPMQMGGNPFNYPAAMYFAQPSTLPLDLTGSPFEQPKM